MLANKLILSLIHLIEKFMNFHDFVTGGIFSLAVITLIYFINLNINMKKGIVYITNVVDNLKGNTEEKILELNEIIRESKNKVIKSNWIKYYETLLEYSKGGVEIDISTFFNKSTLVDIPTKRKLAEIMPGILIATGILGTFTGLVLGLNTFDTSSNDAIQKSMNPLMQGLKVGFLSSVIAIGSSLIWNYIDRLMLHNILRKVNEFQVAYETKFPPDSFNGYMLEMLRIQNAQAAAMEEMKSNITDSQNKSIEELDRKRDSSSFNQSLSEDFRMFFKKIDVLTEKISSNSAGGFNGLEGNELSQQFFINLNNNIEEYFKISSENNKQTIEILTELVASLKNEVTANGGQNEKLSELIKNLEVHSGRMNEGLEKTIELAVNSASTSFTKALNRVGDTLEMEIKDSIDNNMNKIQGDIEATVGEINKDVLEVKDKVTKLVDRMAEKDALEVYKKVDD